MPVANKKQNVDLRLCISLSIPFVLGILVSVKSYILYTHRALFDFETCSSLLGFHFHVRVDMLNRDGIQTSENGLNLIYETVHKFSLE
jgi:hypothetical protein